MSASVWTVVLLGFIVMSAEILGGNINCIQQFISVWVSAIILRYMWDIKLILIPCWNLYCLLALFNSS